MKNRGHLTGSKDWQEWDEQQPTFDEIAEEVHPDPLPKVPPQHQKLWAAATASADDILERAMIDAARSYGAAQTARETYLLDRLRTELIWSEYTAMLYRDDYCKQWKPK